MALRVVINQLRNMENCQKLENCLNSKNCLSQENQKAKKRLSLKIRLSQEKKLSKSGNSTNFNAIENKSKFLTPDARIAFNRLQLAFIKAPIL